MMSLSKQIFQMTLIYLLSVMVFVVIVFIPKYKVAVEFEDREILRGIVRPVAIKYDYYSLENHWNDLSYHLQYMIQNKTLGMTRYDTPIESELFQYLKNSGVVIGAGLLISFVLGVLKGFFDFRMQRKKLSILGHGTTWLFQSIPDFFIILFVQLLLIRYLPITSFYNREGWDAFVLPAILVSIFPMMYIARITSAAIANQAGQLYIQVARAKGLPERKIYFKHIFRNIAGTILTHFPSVMIYLLSNLLLVEYFMKYPGAMYRIWLALNYSAENYEFMNIELDVIMWIGICVTVLIYIVHIISLIAKRFAVPYAGVEQ